MGCLGRSGISLAVCLFLLCGCGVVQRLRPPEPAPPRPASVPAGPFWEKLAERRDAVESLQGLAHVQAVTDRRSVTLDDVVVVARQPEALRLEGIGPFGQPLFLFITDGESLVLYLIRKSRLLVGRATRGNVERLFGIGVAPQALVRVLLGDIPLHPLPTHGDLRYLEAERLYLWEGTQAGPNPTYRVWFDPQSHHPVRFELEDEAGTVVLRVTYADFQPQGALWLPARIDVVEPATQRRATWNYTDVQLNAEVSADLFRVQPPPGTDIRVLREDPA